MTLNEMERPRVRYKPKAELGANPYEYELALNGRRLNSNLLIPGINQGAHVAFNDFVRHWLKIQEEMMGEKIDDAGDDMNKVQAILTSFGNLLNREADKNEAIQGFI